MPASLLSKLARRALALAASRQDRDALLADLEDEARDYAEAHGDAAARRWSERQAVRSIAPLLRGRVAVAATDMRRSGMSILRGLSSDIRLALRRLRHAPGFTAVCVLTLALGIGGNTAVFTLIDRVMLKPLPVPRPSELYRLGDGDDCCVNSGLSGQFSLFSYDLYLRLRDTTDAFTQLAAFQATAGGVAIGRPDAGAPPETLSSAFVSGNYFQMFELTPAAGRLLYASDDRAGAPLTAVISHRAWTRRFQARPDIAGAAVTLNGVPATIVGVAPEGFYGDTLRPDAAEMWVPLSSEPQLQPVARLLELKGSRWLYAIGRLKRGADPAATGERLTATLRQWLSTELELSADERTRIAQQYTRLVPAPAGVRVVRDRFAPSLELLQAIAAALLLVACANLANLLLANGLRRSAEFAVRAALGAPRSRLVAQSLIESILLACAGGLAGLAFAVVGARAIVGLAFRGAADVPVDPAPSFAVIGFAFAASLLTGIVFGAAPALVASRPDPNDTIRGSSRSTTERGSRVRRSLVAVQVAVSLVLITCAGLLGRTLQKLESQDFGLAIDERYIVSLAPSLGTIPSDQLASLYPRMREALRRVPGVRNVAHSIYAPMSGDNWSSGIVVDGHDPAERLAASWNRVSPGYFETVGTPVLQGRGFDERDGASSPLVTVVNAAFVRQFFADGNPIGRHVRFNDARTGVRQRDFEIVGIVADAKYTSTRRPPNPTFFLPVLQESAPATAGAIRYDRSHYSRAIELHAARTPDLEASVRRALAEVDPRLTVRSMVSMDEQVARRFNGERLMARLALAFGATAMLLACLGLYGVTSYAVARRTREIGIRMAIGASRPRVLRTVLTGALWQLALGLAVGVPAALYAARLLESQLFGVTSRDPVVLGSGIALLVAAALLAAAIPSARAAAMDPVKALRVE